MSVELEEQVKPIYEKHNIPLTQNLSLLIESINSNQRDRIQDSYQPKNAEYERERKLGGGEAEFDYAQTIQLME